MTAFAIALGALSFAAGYGLRACKRPGRRKLPPATRRQIRAANEERSRRVAAGYVGAASPDFDGEETR